jgi:hypothetical protein
MPDPILGRPAGSLPGRRPQRKVVCYSGHLLNARDLEPSIQRAYISHLADAVAELLERIGVGWGYGALACGADLVIAEALLEAGAELHAVLPFRSPDFIASSVAAGGKDWLTRFDRCLERAHRLIELDRSCYPVCDESYYLGNRFFAGLAVRRARELDAEAAMLAVWDGVISQGIAGTGRMAAEWAAAGRPLHRLPCPWRRPAPENKASAPSPAGFLPALFCEGEPEVMDELSLLGGASARIDELRLGPSRLAWTFASIAAAAAGAVAIATGDLCRRHRIGILCDVGLAGSTPELSLKRAWGAAAHPECPAGIAFATEPFTAEAALVDASIDCEYAGRVPSRDDSGPLTVYVLRARGTTHLS